MKNSGLYKIIILLLVVLNLCTIAFMWFNRPGRERQEERAGAAANFLIKELNLSAAQQKEYAEMRREHRELLDKLSEQDRVLHKNFFDLLRKEVPDTATVHLVANLIAINRRQMEMVTYDHFAKVSKMLTSDQQKKFNTIIQDVLLMVLPPPPPPSNIPVPPPPPPPGK